MCVCRGELNGGPRGHSPRSLRQRDGEGWRPSGVCDARLGRGSEAVRPPARGPGPEPAEASVPPKMAGTSAPVTCRAPESRAARQGHVPRAGVTCRAPGSRAARRGLLIAGDEAATHLLRKLEKTSVETRRAMPAQRPPGLRRPRGDGGKARPAWREGSGPLGRPQASRACAPAVTGSLRKADGHLAPAP